MAQVSVLDFGADPTGTSDSTKAFMKAQLAADGGTVNVPRGNYRIQPDRKDFRWWSTRWVGECYQNDRNRCSRILPFGPGGDVLVRLPGKGYIESLVIDCENRVQTGLLVQKAHGAYFHDVTVVNAGDYGIQFLESLVTANSVSVDLSAKGILIQGCNAATFLAPSAHRCQGVGLEVRGGAIIPAITTSGGLTIHGALVDLCGQDGQSPLVWFRGVEGGIYQLYYLEGSADAVWLSDNTHNASFIGSRAVIGGNNVLLRLQAARMCTFIGFTAPGENTAVNRVIIDANNSYENEFYNMSRDSRRVNHPTGIVWQDGQLTWAAFERDGRLQATSAPSLGRWERGQVVENFAAAPLSPQGWICVEGSKLISSPRSSAKWTPGIWKPLSPIGA